MSGSQPLGWGLLSGPIWNQAVHIYQQSLTYAALQPGGGGGGVGRMSQAAHAHVCHPAAHAAQFPTPPPGHIGSGPLVYVYMSMCMGSSKKYFHKYCQ